MNIEILTKKQIKEEVAKQVEKKEFQMNRLIDLIQSSISAKQLSK
jgi:hypothetical protein